MGTYAKVLSHFEHITINEENSSTADRLHSELHEELLEVMRMTL